MKKLRNFFRSEGREEAVDENLHNICTTSKTDKESEKNETKVADADQSLGEKLRRTFSSFRTKFRRPPASGDSKKSSTGMKSRQRVYRSKSQVRPLERSSFTGSASSATHYEDVDEASTVISDTRRSSQLGVSFTPNPLPLKSISEELRTLAQYGWYWGPISRTETQNRLASKQDGSFLVRDSCSDYHLLTLSYRCNGLTFHTRTAFFGGFYSLFPLSEKSDLFPSVVELIKYAIERSKLDILCYVHHGREVVAVRLLTPVSRFDHVRSLQSLCRFVIRQNIRWDYIDKLPVPASLKAYLEESHFS